ncbi:hypothetical protein TELCIR_25830, partial [Teladorsagia circumcincta]
RQFWYQLISPGKVKGLNPMVMRPSNIGDSRECCSEFDDAGLRITGVPLIKALVACRLYKSLATEAAEDYLEVEICDELKKYAE